MSHDVQQVRSFEHPGEGRRRAKSTPKGRQVDPQAAEQIALLLGDRPRRRDLLIEHLHLVQDTYHQISAAHLVALAEEMKLAFDFTDGNPAVLLKKLDNVDITRRQLIESGVTPIAQRLG